MNTINENMSVAEVVKRCPNARRIFDQHGLKGCGGENGPSESLSFFATVHQVNLDELVREINDELRNPDPYFVSLDLSTARHPQILLATHLNGKPLTVEHGAPLRLVAPVKLGLKNIKANYADYLYEGRTAGLLGKARVFTLRRNLSAFSRTTCGVNNEQTGSYRCASLPALDNEYGLVVNDISFTDLL